MGSKLTILAGAAFAALAFFGTAAQAEETVMDLCLKMQRATAQKKYVKESQIGYQIQNLVATDDPWTFCERITTERRK